MSLARTTQTSKKAINGEEQQNYCAIVSEGTPDRARTAGKTTPPREDIKRPVRGKNGRYQAQKPAFEKCETNFKHSMYIAAMTVNPQGKKERWERK